MADLKGPSLLRKSKRPENEKENHQRNSNVPFDLKNGQFRVALLTVFHCRVDQSPGGVCQRYMKSLFNTRLLCGEAGRFTRRNKRSNARRFFSRSSPFFWFVLSCFLQFLSFSFSKIKSCPNNFIYVFSLDDGYQTFIYNRDLNITEP